MIYIALILATAVLAMLTLAVWNARSAKDHSAYERTPSEKPEKNVRRGRSRR